MLRTVRDGEPHVVDGRGRARQTATTSGGAPTCPCATSRRATAGCSSAAALRLRLADRRRGLRDHDVPDADGLRDQRPPAPPDWTHDVGRLPDLPRPLRRVAGIRTTRPAAGRSVDLPDWAVPRAWTRRARGPGPEHAARVLRRRPRRRRAHLDHIEALGANVLYLTPFFPAESTHRYDASTFAHVDPLLGGDDALAPARRRRARPRACGSIGDITLNHCGGTHDWFVGARRTRCAASASYFRFDPDAPVRLRVLVRRAVRCRSSTTRVRRLREALVAADGRRPCARGCAADRARRLAGRRGEHGRPHGLDRRHPRRSRKDVRAAMALEGDDLLLVAEHGHDASGDLARRRLARHHELRGLHAPGLVLAAQPGLPRDLHGPARRGAASSPAQQAVASLRAFHARIPWRSLLASWNMLDSHDTARFRTVVGTPSGRSSALGLAVDLPGVPMVFAGDEIGLDGLVGRGRAHAVAVGRPETSWDAARSTAYRALLAHPPRERRARHGRPALAARRRPTRSPSCASTPSESVLVVRGAQPGASRSAFRLADLDAVRHPSPVRLRRPKSSPSRRSSMSRQRVLACGDWRDDSHG